LTDFLTLLGSSRVKAEPRRGQHTAREGTIFSFEKAYLT